MNCVLLSFKCVMSFSLFQTAIDSAISMNDQAVIVDVINILNAKA